MTKLYGSAEDGHGSVLSINDEPLLIGYMTSIIFIDEERDSNNLADTGIMHIEIM